jgi:hypothetical protein
MSSVKRDHHFSSDEDIADDIPLVSEVAELESSSSKLTVARLSTSSVPEIPFNIFRVNWVVGGFSSSIKQIHFLSASDSWVFTAEPKEFNGIPSWMITSPHETTTLGRLEAPKVPAYTLVTSNSSNEEDILGLVWDGNAIKFVFCAPGASTSKDDRLGMVLKDGKPLPTQGIVFTSKKPPVNEKGKPLRYSELPELSELCEKNFVFEDGQGIIVMKIYKMAERFFTVQAVPYFSPLVVFGCAIGVIIK